MKIIVCLITFLMLAQAAWSDMGSRVSKRAIPVLQNLGKPLGVPTDGPGTKAPTNLTDSSVAEQAKKDNDKENAPATSETVISESGLGLLCETLSKSKKAAECYSNAGQPLNPLHKTAFSEMLVALPKYTPGPRLAPLSKELIKPEDRCECIRNEVKVSDNERKEAKKKINEFLRISMNKNLMNDYANHFEDVWFFNSNSAQVFSGIKEYQGEEADKVLCRDPEKFKKAIVANPKCRNISTLEQEKRMNEVLTSFGNKLDGTWIDKLKKIQTQIITDKVSPKESDVDERTKKDKEAFQLARNSPAFLTANNLMTSILEEKSLKAKLLENGRDGRTPEEVLANVIEKELGAPGENNAKALFNGVNGIADQMKLLERTIKLTIRYHPGYARFFSDKKLFLTVVEKIADSPVVTDFLENDISVKKHFEHSCATITEQFAKAVCSTDEELFQSTNFEDLDHLLNAEDSPLKLSKVGALLVCEQADLSPSVSSISPGFNTSRKSKYHDLVTGSKENPIENIVDDAAINPNGQAAQVVNQAKARFPNVSVSGSSEYSKINILPNYIPKAIPVSPEELARDSASLPAPSTTMAASNAPAENGAEAQTQLGGPFFGPGQPSAGSNTSSKPAPTFNSSSGSETNVANSEIETPEEKMLKFLANSPDGEVANELVKGSNDELMNELIKLKQETEKNQARLAEITSDNEKLKFQMQEAKLAKLQRDLAALTPGEQPVKAPDYSSRIKSFKSIYREPTQESYSDNNGFNNNFAAFNPPAGQSSTAKSASLGKSARNSGSSATNSRKSTDVYNPVVLSASSGTPRVGYLEVKSPEVEKEVSEYIVDKVNDIQTLIDLKSSGIVYKYKATEESGEVVEKEVLIEYKNLNESMKKIVDEKIAKNKDESVIAKERLTKEIEEQKRVYSYSALKIILGEQLRK